MSNGSNRLRAKKNSNRKTTQLGIEQLETRMMNAVSGIEQNLQLLLSPNLSGSTQLVTAVVANTAPTVASQARLTSGTEVRGQSTTVSVLGSDNGGEANLTYTWQTTSAPNGARVQFATNGTNGAKSNTLTFSKAGIYSVNVKIQDQSGLFTTSTLRFNVAQVLTTLSFTTVTGAAVNADSPISVTGASLRLNARGVDQFGTVMTSLPSLTWTKLTGPTGGTVSASVANGVATIAFNKTGSYTFKAQNGALVANLSANVIPTLTAISLRNAENRVLTPGTAVTLSATSQRWTAVGLDQFNVVMAQQPVIDWSTVSSPSGGAPSLQSADNAANVTFSKSGSYLFRAKSGSLSAQLPVNVTQTLTTIRLLESNGNTVNSAVPVNLAGTNLKLNVRGLDQFGLAMASLPALTWTTTKVPTGGTASGTLSAGVATLNFTRAGAYGLTVRSGVATTTFQVTVAQTMTSLSALGADNRALATTSPIIVSGTSQTLRVRALDQFGQLMSTQPTFNWTALTAPASGNATIQSTDSATVVSFNKAGTYAVKVNSGSTLLNISFNVTQRLTSIGVTPGSTSVNSGSAQQFVGRALDQFQQVMNTPTTLAWSASGGMINASGVYTAGAQAGTYSISARTGTVVGTITVTVTTPPPQTGLRDASLRSTLNSLYADGSLNRTEMIQLLRSAGTDGTVDQTELTDLRWLVSSTSFAMPSYVRELARDVVNENPANRFFQGTSAGNLIAGSNSSLLNKLVDKWFLGADMPALTSASLTYQISTGNLFNGAPSRADTRQGSIGDCYFIASIAAIADQNPDAVRNMFIDNGDNTYTVRFYAGALGQFNQGGTITAGFVSGTGTADYVTVNRKLATNASGRLAYSGAGQVASSSSTTLWIALAEKAYAQWNETGNEGRDGTNTYRGIEGGWMSNVNAQVLGYNSTNYSLSSSTKQTMITALNSGRSVTIGTMPSATAGGLVGSHAYIVAGYNAGTDTFTLHNPWGFQHPTALTWAQLQSNCSAFSTTNPAGSTAISLFSVRSSATDTLVGNWTTIVVTGNSTTVADTAEIEPSALFVATESIDNATSSEHQATSEWVTWDDTQAPEITEIESQILSDLDSLAVDLAMSMEHLDAILG